MNIVKVVTELKAYLAQIEEAIAALEGLARRRGKRRGRPPKWLSAGPHVQKRVVSEASRKKMAAAQRRRWKLVRKANKAG
jgi:hypothetical protein